MNASRLVGALLAVALVAAIVASQSCATVSVPAEPAAQATAACVVDVAQLGLPTRTDGGPGFLFLKNSGYACLYDEQRENPACVTYLLSGSPSRSAYKRKERFEADARTTSKVRSEDYLRTGYDRGHMAPSHAMFEFFGEPAETQTYLMSNVVPQKHALNAGPWERVESLEADSWSPRYGKIRVYCGPTYGGTTTTIGHGVAVPTATWKIEVRIGADGRLDALAFLMPQAVGDSDPPERFLASVRSIETATHLDFFTELSRDEQDALETHRARSLWP